MYKGRYAEYGEGKFANEFSPNKHQPNIKEFLDVFMNIANDVGTDGTVGSHYSLQSQVSVEGIDPDDDAFYKIVAMEAEQLGGCGCWSGVRILVDRQLENEMVNISRAELENLRKDKKRVDYMQSLVWKAIDKNLCWDTFQYYVDKPIREQLDEHIKEKERISAQLKAERKARGR